MKQMIFISHSHKDKGYVDAIAQQLAETFGQQHVFYDSWSIQPGESIIGQMNTGLEACSHFFFFVSEHSKASYAAGLEWQGALFRAGSGNLKFVPIRAADCQMPAVLAEHRYIDLYTQGIDIALREMRDVVRGQNVYQGGPKHVENLVAKAKREGQKVEIEIEAQYFVAPVSRFIFVLATGSVMPQIWCGESHFSRGEVKLTNGAQAPWVDLHRAIAPGRGLRVFLQSEGVFTVEAVLHWNTDRVGPLPVVPLTAGSAFPFTRETNYALPAGFGASWKPPSG